MQKNKAKLIKITTQCKIKVELQLRKKTTPNKAGQNYLPHRILRAAYLYIVLLS